MGPGSSESMALKQFELTVKGCLKDCDGSKFEEGDVVPIELEVAGVHLGVVDSLITEITPITIEGCPGAKYEFAAESDTFPELMGEQVTTIESCIVADNIVYCPESPYCCSDEQLCNSLEIYADLPLDCGVLPPPLN